jgi:uncharacterized membrane protein
MNAKDQGPTHHILTAKPKKIRNNRAKKKIRKSKSLFSTAKETKQPRTTISERKDEYVTNFIRTSRYASPNKVKRTTIVKPPSPKVSKSPAKTNDSLLAAPKEVHKVKKKLSKPSTVPISGVTPWP